jgi:hypothetical protein
MMNATGPLGEVLVAVPMLLEERESVAVHTTTIPLVRGLLLVVIVAFPAPAHLAKAPPLEPVQSSHHRVR